MDDTTTSLATGLSDWKTGLAYAILICLYFLILRLLMNMLQQLTKKHRTEKSIVDVDIKMEAANSHMDDTATFDPYKIAVAIVRTVMTAVAIIGVALILIFKIGIWLSICVAIALAAVVWAANSYRVAHEEEFAEYTKWINRVGSNIITVTILVIALICTAVALLLLPS